MGARMMMRMRMRDMDRRDEMAGCVG
jgi:hypothetical protein